LGLCAGATSKDCSLVKVVMIRLMWIKNHSDSFLAISRKL
jgi:hypothetical protein